MNRTRLFLCAALLALGFTVSYSQAPANTNKPPGFLPGLKAIFKGGREGGLATLSEEQVSMGLREALGQGLQQAVAALGRTNGFLTNSQVRIPMPEQLKKVESALRSLKQDQLADNFVVAINRAAEQAVPQAAAVFSDAVKQMTIADAKDILTGPDDAATKFFRRNTQTNLYARFLPIVQKATESAGATAAYKNLVDYSKNSAVGKRLGGLRSALGFGGPDPASLDLDGYVTTQALDGLFKMVAEEEKLIRKDPQARTTELLQKVFGAARR